MTTTLKKSLEGPGDPWQNRGVTTRSDVTTAPTKLLPKAGSRGYAIIKNAGPDDAYVEIGSDAKGVTADRGVSVPAGESLFYTTRDMSHVAREEMWAVSDGTSEIWVQHDQ